MLLNNMGHDIFWYTELNRDFSSRQRVGEGIPASCSIVLETKSGEKASLPAAAPLGSDLRQRAHLPEAPAVACDR